MTLYIMDTCGTVIAPPVANEVSRTPLLSRTEMVTPSLEKSAVTRRPRSLGDRPFGRSDVHHHVPDRAVGGQIEFGVTPAHERPSIHAVGDQPRGRPLDAFDRDGVVAEYGDEAVALGWAWRLLQARKRRGRSGDRVI